MRLPGRGKQQQRGPQNGSTAGAERRGLDRPTRRARRQRRAVDPTD